MDHLLHSRNPIIRKATAHALKIPRLAIRQSTSTEDLERWPPVLVNSFPKSGTHLLEQIVAGLPNRRNFGSFIASMTSSFWFRERTPDNTVKAISLVVPGEIVRAHLFYDERYAKALTEKRYIQYFIYRDPRDVAVSDAFYLRHMNRWHKLHRYFKRLKNDEEAILHAIKGFPADSLGGASYPDIGQRFARYAGWLDAPNVFSVRFEDLVGSNRTDAVQGMLAFYGQHSSDTFGNEETIDTMNRQFKPGNSHTFRQGKSGGWKSDFTDEMKQAFKEVAGDLLVRLGYEEGDAW